MELVSLTRDTGNEVWVWLTDHATVISAVITAIATVVMVFFTGKLTKQLDLARREFISTHRPKISVRAFRLHIEDDLRQCHIEFICLNEGVTNAHIKEIGTALIQGTNPWNYGARKVRYEIKKPDIRLMAGEQSLELTIAKFDSNQTSDWLLIGYILYEDDLRVSRKTSFFRRWNGNTKNWDRYQNEEYEYSY